LAYGVLTNVSERGACIVTDSRLSPGAEVDLKLSFYQEPGLIETSARIVWNRIGSGREGNLRGLQLHGVQFVDTSDMERSRLGQLLHSEDFEPVQDSATPSSGSSEFARLRRALSVDLDRLAEKLSHSIGRGSR
jgi:hypothetical protein